MSKKAEREYRDLVENWGCSFQDWFEDFEKRTEKYGWWPEKRSVLAVDSIKSVNFNVKKNIVTIVFKDGTVSHSKCAEEDRFDPIVGFSVALTNAVFGGATPAHKFILDKFNHQEKVRVAKERAQDRKKTKEDR